MDKICILINQANELIEKNNPIQLIDDLNNTISNQEIEINKLSMSLKNIDNKYLEQIKKLQSEIDSKNIELKQKNEEINNFAKFSIIQKVNKQLEERNNYIQILESQIEKIRKYKVEPISPKIVQSEEITEEPNKKYKNKIIDEKSEELVVGQVEETIIESSKELLEETIIVTVKEQVEESVEESINEQVEEPIKKSRKKNKIIEEPIEEPVEEQIKEQIKEQIEEQIIKPKNKINEEQIEIIIEEPVKKSKKKDKMIEEFRNDIFNPDIFNEINGYQLIIYKKKYYLRDLETNQLYDIDNYKPNKVVGIYTINGKVKLNM
jgi:hypothetical protein